LARFLAFASAAGTEEIIALRGRFIDPRVSASEVLASGRWAVIALEQTDRHMIGGEPDLDPAWSGRRMTEDELET
jgi:hypothetical protein